MEPLKYDYRTTPKQFCADVEYKAIVPSNSYCSQTHRMLYKLSKVGKEDAKQYSDVADILRCYLEKPTVIRGKRFVDTDLEMHNKMKYHTTFSCSQNSKPTTLMGSAVFQSARTTTNDDSKPSYKLESYCGDYSYTKLPVSSTRSVVPLPHFDDKYFDLLDLPGHFNTRGIFGQRANMATFGMRRTNSELHLPEFRSRFVTTERQRTQLSINLHSSDKFEDTSRTSRKTELAVYRKHKNIGVQAKPRQGQSERGDKSAKFIPRKQTTGLALRKAPKVILPERDPQLKVKNSLRMHKSKGRKLIDTDLKMTEKDGHKELLEVTTNIPKRVSVDASMQTDGDYTDEESEYFVF